MMGRKIRLLVVLFLVLVPAGLSVAGPPPALPTSGKVLVLDNERTLEGDIERVGEQYRLRRPIGELWVPAETTLRLCETREEAFSFLRGRANLLDPDERLRLARWCLTHGLRRQALAEAAAAVELRPNHAESRRLLRSLQRANAEAASAQVSRSADDRLAAAPPPELSTEAVSLFVTRVQPILMNACASCHSTGRGGAFKLVRTYERGSITQKTTQQNLSAVVAEISRDRPTASPLLSKAVTIHGKPGEMTQAPLKNREVPAYHSLEEWVRITVDHKDPPHEVLSVRAAPVESVPMTEPAGRHPATTEKVGETKAAPESADPFDPGAFNRQMHPQTAGNGSSPEPGKRGG